MAEERKKENGWIKLGRLMGTCCDSPKKSKTKKYYYPSINTEDDMGLKLGQAVPCEVMLKLTGMDINEDKKNIRFDVIRMKKLREG